MIVEFETNCGRFAADLARPVAISIPLDFGGSQPNAYGVDPAVSKACEYGELVGDTRRGGSCNFEEIRVIPHCNGTHTECAGHITDERISVDECLRSALMTAVVVSVAPVFRGETPDETYGSVSADGDPWITRSALAEALGQTGGATSDAIIVRTLPNEGTKTSRLYLDEIPPYFTTEAMELIVARGYRHLLTDLPSIDRLFDDGRLSNHRIFWKIEPGSNEPGEDSRLDATVTELAFIPDEVADGIYGLSIQIPSFRADAAPSRPLVFPLSSIK